MDETFARLSWGAPDGHSYYTNAAGHASFLFAGTFREYQKLHEGVGLHEYDVA